MNPSDAQRSSKDALLGFFTAAGAFLIWGVSPIYWKELHPVPAIEIVTHRVVWSLVLLLPLLAVPASRRELGAAARNASRVATMLATTLLISTNWLIFIWAVNHGHVLQTSLGYYMNPLVNVLLGVIFLRESLRPLQLAAVLLAATAVLSLTVTYGTFPWIALTLAFSFGFYGLIRKTVPLSSVVGLFMEMLLLAVPAAAYLIHLDRLGTGAFLHLGLKIDGLLVATAFFTAVPLILFTLGARRLHLSTLGFLQYLAPTCFFLCAVFVFHEPVSTAQIVTFGLIWAALALYSWDSVMFYRRSRRMRAGRAGSEHHFQPSSILLAAARVASDGSRPPAACRSLSKRRKAASASARRPCRSRQHMSRR